MSPADLLPARCVLAITGASAALALSEIPFEKTIAGVRVGIVDGNYVINPTFEERKKSTLDLIVAGSADGILMVEAGAKEVTEPQVVGALEAAHEAIKKLVVAIDELKAVAGKKKLVIGGVICGDDPTDDYFVQSHGVATPSAFWKVIIRGADRVIAWVVPNTKAATYKRLDQYLVTVEEVEQRTGETFPEVPEFARSEKPEVSWIIPIGCDKG